MILDCALIGRADKAFTAAWQCFGLEAKAAWLLEDSRSPRAARKAYYRPMPEPILVSFWAEFADWRLTTARALDLASLLTGQRQSYRTKPIYGTDEHQRRFYFARSSGAEGLSIFFAAAGHDAPLEAALTNLFLSIIFAHPFTDGNGRFARASLIGLLAHRGLIATPCLPLNSVFDARAPTIAAAVRAAVQHGQKHLLQAMLVSAIDAAAELAVKAQFPLAAVKD